MASIITGGQVETPTNKVSELKLVSPDGLIEKSIVVSNAGVVTIDSINPLEKTLLKEYIVSGSAVTTIDITDLDINAHKSYRIECEIINPTGTHAAINMFINGDTSVPNYFSQYLHGAGTTVGAVRTNAAYIVYVDANCQSNSFGALALNNGLPLYFGGFGDNAATLRAFTLSYKKTSTVANITKLTFTSNVANTIGVGSRIRIYRGDL